MTTGSSPEAAEVDPIDAPQPDAENSAAAASSPAADDKGEKSLLDSVQEALGSKAEPPAAEQDPKTSPSQAGAEAEQPKPESLSDEVPEEEMKRYGPKTQARIRQLLEGRHAAREEANSLKPKAAEFDKFDNFVRQNQLSPEDVSATFNIAAAIRNDPHKAWDMITPIVRQLAEIVGHVLPADLQEEVRLGYITEQRARELAQTRSKTSLLEQRTTQSEERRKQEDERNRLSAHAATCRDTANDWEAQKKASDPDWNLKQGRITEKLKLKLHENGGFPETKQKVVEWLDEIHKQVTEEIKGFVPRPKPITPPNPGNASSRANAEPQTALEAAELALARH